MAPARRTRKATVDYSVLSGKRKRSIQTRVQDARGRRQRAPQVSPGMRDYFILGCDPCLLFKFSCMYRR